VSSGVGPAGTPQPEDEKVRVNPTPRAGAEPIAALADAPARDPSAAPPAASAAEPNAAPAARAARESPFKVQGIYLQQNTLLTPKRLEHMIDNSVDVGVNTMVVDLWWPSPNYKKSVERIQERGIRFVPRVTMFPDGGTREQINDQAYWEARYKLVSYALDLGAKDVQLDYIRYNVRTPASPNNALDIREVLRFFKKRVNERGSRLQIDVFGEVSFGPSLHIGQDIGVFAKEIDAVCPMVYPSHYEPYEEHAHLPYETVYGSLTALKRQMGSEQVPVLAYIELFNHRHKMDESERINYIRAELRAVREAKAEGWLAWSAGNYYDILFDILRRYRDESPG
jgi:hypothetical protein